MHVSVYIGIHVCMSPRARNARVCVMYVWHRDASFSQVSFHMYSSTSRKTYASDAGLFSSSCGARNGEIPRVLRYCVCACVYICVHTCMLIRTCICVYVYIHMDTYSSFTETELCCGHEGLLRGLTGLFCGFTVLICQNIGLSYEYIGVFWGYIMLFNWYIRLFCGCIGLFCGNVGLDWEYIRLFHRLNWRLCGYLEFTCGRVRWVTSQASVADA